MLQPVGHTTAFIIYGGIWNRRAMYIIPTRLAQLGYVGINMNSHLYEPHAADCTSTSLVSASGTTLQPSPVMLINSSVAFQQNTTGIVIQGFVASPEGAQRCSYVRWSWMSMQCVCTCERCFFLDPVFTHETHSFYAGFNQALLTLKNPYLMGPSWSGMPSPTLVVIFTSAL